MTNEFFTWSTLETSAGAVLLTSLVARFCKGTGIFKIIPIRLFNYIVAVANLVLANVFTSSVHSFGDYVLCLFNGMIVALAATSANDAYDEVSNKLHHTKKNHELNSQGGSVKKRNSRE